MSSGTIAKIFGTNEERDAKAKEAQQKIRETISAPLVISVAAGTLAPLLADEDNPMSDDRAVEVILRTLRLAKRAVKEAGSQSPE